MGETEYREIRLTEDAYQRLEACRRPDESISEVVERIAGERSLVELAGLVTDEEASAMRKAIRKRERQYRARLGRDATEIEVTRG
ncbi:antitoxin VapB family protein [Halovivax cerinus]|uniref:Antitoxin VapB family protein n=1 Tax=Halovivax cerinus TaxID=1487865 RepID=A0ABD5NTS6_9EURY|nr:antitoxin VapB family protein [Halovivax cerinus]